MNRKRPIVAYEFGTLYIEGQAHKEGDIPLKEGTFNNLWNFILSNKADNDTDVIMSVHTRGGRRYIKTGRFVGTIQTKDGQIIEILPKIYKSSGQQEEDQEVCRKIFLNMLRHFTEAKGKSFQNASLSTKKGFPILEVYISNYIKAVEQLTLAGLKKNYAIIEENGRFLKGKLDINKQLTKNIANKTSFAIRYNKYLENIPQNRLIVTTLNKLLKISHSNYNKAHISALLTYLADIPASTNVELDLKIASTNNRLFAGYDLLIKWSGQFLLNKGFTTFSGDCVNQSLLFQAERLFEDFIAYLFKKYAPYYNVEAQNTRYFLIDRHNGRKMFHLRPDILIESTSEEEFRQCVIIDTKWKSLDSTKPDKNYLLDIKDMYQLYAYGQKYRLGESKNREVEIIPQLILLYPYSEKFTHELPAFIYDEIEDDLGLKLRAIPFNLADPSTYQDQIEHILCITRD
jgi:5-methylcytosine-specific restriction enzyme subunit McrC